MKVKMEEMKEKIRHSKHLKLREKWLPRNIEREEEGLKW